MSEHVMPVRPATSRRYVLRSTTTTYIDLLLSFLFFLPEQYHSVFTSCIRPVSWFVIAGSMAYDNESANSYRG